MGLIHIELFATLDLVAQAPGGPEEDPQGFPFGGWQAPLLDDISGAQVAAAYEGTDALLLGRRTYDIFAAYWPYVDGEGKTMGEAFTAANKYVLTRGEQPFHWANSHCMRNMEAVAMLKQSDGPDLLIQGSSTIYPSLLAAGLLDRLVLYTFPILLGSGKRLFGEGTPSGTLKLVAHRVTPGGTAIATYEPAGSVETGSFGAIKSAREDERQRHIQDGTW